MKQNEESYHRTMMQKEKVIQKLKDKGCRITKQRLVLLDIILGEECSCCKEIHYKATRIDPRIGAATVYRMVNTLEEIGAISRKNMYKIDYGEERQGDEVCRIELDDNTACYLSDKKLNQVIQAGLKSFGFVENQHVKKVLLR